MLETNTADNDELNRIDDCWVSVYNILEKIRKDLEEKIREASKSLLSAVINLASTLVNDLYYEIRSSRGARIVTPIVLRGAHTIGGIIETGDAHKLLTQLNDDLDRIRKLQIQRQTLAAEKHIFH
jgi:hypothetical protein